MLQGLPNVANDRLPPHEGDARKGPLSENDQELLQDLYLMGVPIEDIAATFRRSQPSILAIITRLKLNERCLPQEEGITWPMVYESLWGARLRTHQGSYYLDGEPIHTRALTLKTAEMLRGLGRPTPPMPQHWQ